jgi:hypothetical protein
MSPRLHASGARSGGAGSMKRRGGAGGQAGLWEGGPPCTAAIANDRPAPMDSTDGGTDLRVLRALCGGREGGEEEAGGSLGLFGRRKAPQRPRSGSRVWMPACVRRTGGARALVCESSAVESSGGEEGGVWERWADVLCSLSLRRAGLGVGRWAAAAAGREHERGGALAPSSHTRTHARTQASNTSRSEPPRRPSLTTRSARGDDRSSASPISLS